MSSRVTRGQLIIIVSLVFISLGLFTALPYYILSTFGVFGFLAGWLMDIKVKRKEEEENNSDVNINVTDTHPVNFDKRLRKLEQLKSDNIITEEEYSNKRQEIMADRW